MEEKEGRTPLRTQPEPEWEELVFGRECTRSNSMQHEIRRADRVAQKPLHSVGTYSILKIVPYVAGSVLIAAHTVQIAFCFRV